MKMHECGPKMFALNGKQKSNKLINK